MRQHLVGYILGALEKAEYHDLEEQLARDKRLKEELSLLRSSVEPLDFDGDHLAPPTGLAVRTCAFVEAQRTRAHVRVPAAKGSTVGRTNGLAPELNEYRSGRRWNVADVSVAAGIVIAASLLILPAINHSRFNAHVASCQNNLKDVGEALHRHADLDAGQQIPSIPTSGPLSVAGVYAPKLLEKGLITEPRTFVCSGSNGDAEGQAPEIPTWGNLVNLVDRGDNQLDESVLRTIGGSYAYNLGYMEDDAYRTVSLANPRESFVLMADSPCGTRDWEQSSNHGGCGQNVLFEDGHVGFLSGCRSPGCNDQDFFRNDAGEIAAGSHRGDSVVGHCLARPMN